MIHTRKGKKEKINIESYFDKYKDKIQSELDFYEKAMQIRKKKLHNIIDD